MMKNWVFLILLGLTHKKLSFYTKITDSVLNKMAGYYMPWTIKWAVGIIQCWHSKKHCAAKTDIRTQNSGELGVKKDSKWNLKEIKTVGKNIKK